LVIDDYVDLYTKCNFEVMNCKKLQEQLNKYENYLKIKLNIETAIKI